MITSVLECGIGGGKHRFNAATKQYTIYGRGRNQHFSLGHPELPGLVRGLIQTMFDRKKPPSRSIKFSFSNGVVFWPNEGLGDLIDGHLFWCDLEHEPQYGITTLNGEELDLLTETLINGEFNENG